MKQLACIRHAPFLVVIIAIIWISSAHSQTSDSTRTDSTRLRPDSLALRLREEVREERTRREEQSVKIPSASALHHDSTATWLQTAAAYLPQLGRARYPNGTDDMLWLHPLVNLEPWRRWPMRTTASIAGTEIGGFGSLYEQIPLDPFEHALEPNGATDLLSLPDMMAEGDQVFLSGMTEQFGANNLVNSVFTLDSGTLGNPQTTLLHDRGTLNYSYTRGRYHNRFRNGREISLGLGYRLSTDPETFGRYDQYQYAGSLKQPLARGWELTASGTLNDLEAPIYTQPELGAAVVRRELQQRQLHAALSRHTAKENRSTSRAILLDYSRQHSHADGVLSNRFDQWKYRFGYQQSHWFGRWGVQSSLGIQSDEYRSGVGVNQRTSYDARTTLIQKNTRSVFGMTASLVIPAGRNLLPAFSATYGISGDAWSIWWGLSYTSRAPSLHELFLPFRTGNAVPSLSVYTEQGKSDLRDEHRLSFSTTVTRRSEHSNLSLLFLSGVQSQEIGWSASLDSSSISFQPDNRNRRFIALGAVGDLRVFKGGLLFGSLGGWTSSDPERDRHPQFQATVGGDLEIPIRSRLITLRGSTEVRFVSEWTGLYGEPIGGTAESYSTLCLVMKSFEIHWIITNGLNSATALRDFAVQPERLDRIGLVWHFLD